MVSIHLLPIKYNSSHYSSKMSKEECTDIYYAPELHPGIECWRVIDSHCDSSVLNKGINTTSGADNVLWEKLVVGIRTVLTKGLSGYVSSRNIRLRWKHRARWRRLIWAEVKRSWRKRMIMKLREGMCPVMCSRIGWYSLWKAWRDSLRSRNTTSRWW